MATRDLYNDIKLVTMQAPTAAKTSATTSGTVDTQGFEKVVIELDIGTTSDTLSVSLLWTFKLQECTTVGGTYTDVAATDIIVDGGTLNTSNTIVINAPAQASKPYKMGYRGGKEFLQVVATPTGSISGGLIYGVTAILGGDHINPAV